METIEVGVEFSSRTKCGLFQNLPECKNVITITKFSFMIRNLAEYALKFLKEFVWNGNVISIKSQSLNHKLVVFLVLPKAFMETPLEKFYKNHIFEALGRKCSQG